MTVVQNILNIAKKNKINNQELCQILNSNPNKIYDWKVGKSKPSTDEICILADYFDVSTDYLLGRTDEQNIYHTNNVSSNIVQKDGSIATFGSIAVGSTFNNSCNDTSLSKEETEILNIYRSLNIRRKAKFLNMALDIEQEENN